MRLGAGVQVSAGNMQIERRGLGDGVAAFAGIVRVDRPRVDQALDAGLQRAFGDQPRGVDLESLIFRPCLYVRPRQVHYTIDAPHGAEQGLAIEQIAGVAVDLSAQFLGKTGCASHQHADATTSRNQLPQQFFADEARAAEHENVGLGAGACQFRLRPRRNRFSRQIRPLRNLLAHANYARAELPRNPLVQPFRAAVHCTVKSIHGTRDALSVRCAALFKA